MTATKTRTTTRRAITYGRVSTGKQAERGLSLGDQADRLAAVIAERGWVHIDHVTDPGLSGRKMTNRRGLLDALDRLDRGEADVLVAAKLDRVCARRPYERTNATTRAVTAVDRRTPDVGSGGMGRRHFGSVPDQG